MKEKESQQGAVKEPFSGRRSPCEVTCIHGEKTYTGTSMHFNEHGMLIMCKHPAPLNAKVRVQLQFPGFRNTLDLNGEVVWTNIHGSADSLIPRGMGVKFLNLERDTERLLGELAAQYECLVSVYSCYYT